MLILARTSMVAQKPQRFKVSRLAASNCAGIAVGTKILPGIETEAGQTARRSNLSVSVNDTMCLSCVLNNIQSVPLRNLLDIAQIHGAAKKVNGDNSTRSGRYDCLCVCGIQMKGLRVYI